MESWSRPSSAIHVKIARKLLQKLCHDGFSGIVDRERWKQIYMKEVRRFESKQSQSAAKCNFNYDNLLLDNTACSRKAIKKHVLKAKHEKK